jgi:tetraacyldisaccharide 4'-kinase
VSRFDQDAFLRLIRGQSAGLAANVVRGALCVPAAAYRAAVGLRNLGFDRGWIEVHRAQIPVVSIGNLTVGGTGKTPMVEWVARRFRNAGVRVAIASRGYRGGQGPNDEARLLEENLPDVPHLQDGDRVRSARIATDELAAELLVLDDGFQHRRLARELDVVMIDALEPFGLGHLLPRGLLREPVGSLSRANLVVLSRSDLIGAAERAVIRQEVKRRGGPSLWVETRHAARDLIDCDGSVAPAGELAGESIAAFCGIGNPEGFRRTVQPLCRTLRDLRVYPDHHAYSSRDMESLASWARDLGVDLVLTTQKDLVKLRASTLGRARLRALRIGLEITSGEDVMEDALARLPGRSMPV